MDYEEAIDKHLDITYVDLLERIKLKFGSNEFVIGKSLKTIRIKRWQQAATSAGISLADCIYAAIEKMAKDKEKCIKILGTSDRVLANTRVQFARLPAARGKDAIKAYGKEKLIEEADEQRNRVAELEALLEKKERQLKKQKDEAAKWRAKAGEVVLKAEKWSDFPECYRTKKYDEWLPPIVDGKRPKFAGADWWPAIEKHLPFVDQWQKEEEDLVNSKRPEHIRELARKKLVSITNRNRGSELRSAIGQYFHFITMTQHITWSKFKPTEEQLFSKITVLAFCQFYKKYAGSPSSVSNLMGNLCSLYRYTQTIERFQPRYSRITSIIECLRSMKNKNKPQIGLHRTRNGLDDYLQLRGKWLRSTELAELNLTISTSIVEFLDAHPVTATKEEALDLQSLLILYSFLQLGGQRREVVGSFMIGNFASVDNIVVHFTLDEKVQKRGTDRLPLPDTLGKLLRIWIERYRVVLCPATSKVVSCWVNQNGQPLSFKNISLAVNQCIMEQFPHRKIGPLALRQIFMSLMQEIASSDHEQFRNWDTQHAALCNTSAAVLQQNYNRWNNKERPARTLEKINNSLKLNPTEGIADTITHHAENIDYLAETPGMVTKVIDERFVEREHQYLCVMESGEKKWLPTIALSPYESVVLEYFKACIKKKKAKPSQAKQTQVQANNKNAKVTNVPALESADF